MAVPPELVWAELILAAGALLLLPIRAAVMAVAAALLLRYGWWRLTATLPPFEAAPAALWMWGLAGMEMLALANTVVTLLFLSRRSNRRAEADAGEQRLLHRSNLPAVDVLIPSYNEPLAVLERSIIGALALDWPQVRVWVLDDGRRDWLRDFCAAKGAAWITRPDNAAGKAGNINAWLRRGGGTAPYVMVLDADFVPQRHFLKRVMGFFDDDCVALVQTPQSFFNPDPIQMNLLCGNSFADEQRFFYHTFQPALDAWGAAFCCGTSFVVRRDRLDAVGGIPTCTVTEDMMTTYALARRGWRTLYLDEKLSSGMAPEGLGEFIGQRARWCLGTVQALRSASSPLGGLGWAHRLCFLNAQLFWLASVPMMLLAMVAPVIFWWTGTPAFLADPGEFARYFLPRFLAEALVMAWVSRWSIVPVLSGLAPLVSAPAAVAAAVKAFGGEQKFKVTLKGGDRRKVVVHGRMLGWLGGLMAAIALGMVVGQIPDLAPAGGASINLGWSFYALVLLFLAMLVCVELPRPRREERLILDEPTFLGGLPARLVDLSLNGACVESDLVAEAAVLQVTGVAPLAARLVRRRGRRLFLEFVDAAEQRDALIRKLYCGPAALPPEGLNPMRAIRGALRRGFVSEN